MEGVRAGASITSGQALLVQPYLPIIKIVFYCRCLQRPRQALPTSKTSAVKKMVVWSLEIARCYSFPKISNHRMSFQNLEKTNSRIFLSRIPLFILTARLLSSFLADALTTWPTVFQYVQRFYKDLSYCKSLRLWLLSHPPHYTFSSIPIQTLFHHPKSFHIEASWVLKDFWVILHSTKILLYTKLWRTKASYSMYCLFSSPGVSCISRKQNFKQLHCKR